MMAFGSPRRRGGGCPREGAGYPRCAAAGAVVRSACHQPWTGRQLSNTCEARNLLGLSFRSPGTWVHECWESCSDVLLGTFRRQEHSARPTADKDIPLRELLHAFPL